jgi:hypothetical protein
MNDDQLGRDIVAALRKDDPGAVPARLSGRVASVPDETARRGSGSFHSSRLSPMLRTLEAIAAVVVVGALIAGTLILRGNSVGQVSGSNPSGSDDGTPSTIPSGTLATDTPTSSQPVSQTPAPAARWTGLKWSDPSSIPQATGIEDIVAWNGQYFAAGRAGQANTSGGQLPVGIWRSTNGTAWTQVSLGASTFLNSNVAGLVGTPAGLVAWGTAGDPTCSGEGEGMTCGTTPVMLWTSPNGTDWARVSDLSLFQNATLWGVAYGSLGLVAVGDTGFNEPAIWVSATGATWQRTALPSDVFADAHFSSISATATGYVMGGSTGGTAPASGGVQMPSTGAAAAWWSDGQAWHKATVNRTDGVGTSLDAIHVGSKGMVGIGSAAGGKVGAAWNSSDGKTWQPIDGAPSASTLPSFSVAGDGTRLVATGDGANGQVVIWASDDGVTWTALPFSGATGTVPSVVDAFLVPGGLIVILVPIDTGGPNMPVWHVTATS